MGPIWLLAAAASPFIALGVFCLALLWSVQLLGWLGVNLGTLGFDELKAAIEGHWVAALPRVALARAILTLGGLAMDAQAWLSRWGCLQLDRVAALMGMNQ